MSDLLTIKAPAKINLGLRVGPEDPSGYHKINTVLQRISVYDRLDFGSSPTTEDTLEVNGPVTVPSSDENLILRTLNRVRENGLDLPPLSVRLRKEIPSGAGLGGGSSNAAATLKAVTKIMEHTIDQSTLYDLADEIGSDVPFFLKQGTQLGTGRGASLRALPDLDGEGLLCVPPYSVATEWAYSNVESRPEEELQGIIKSGSEAELSSWRELDLTNDFEPLIARNYELHNSITETLNNMNLTWALTGSGSALYVLFEDPDRMVDRINELTSTYGECEWHSFNFIR
ncbi:MAG: 4-(cytidine 5'-diphospho)-2-C-methyl-D-erythritol kinase [bacterium]